MSNSFNRAVEFVLMWEGGLSTDSQDPGNWTGGAVGEGALVGTKFGISAAAYPDVDIVNLTRGDAEVIYRRDYWDALGLNDASFSPEMQLVLFDSAVQHGVGTVRTWVKAFGSVESLLLHRMRFYLNLRGFDRFGRGWMRRLCDLMSEVFGSISDPLSDVTSFYLVCSESLTIPLPFVKASVVGSKLYVRLYRLPGEFPPEVN